jgi:hypothetical protein
MALEKLTLSKLADIDGGRIRVAFEQALHRLEADCKDRPSVETARKIALTATLIPIANEDGELESVNITFQVFDDVPKRTSKTYNAKSTAAGLFFNELSKEDIRQSTLEYPAAPKAVADVG